MPNRLTVAKVLLFAASTTACGSGKTDEVDADAIPSALRPVRAPAHYSLGTPATREKLAPVDIDANPAGAGLPAGEGTAAQGAPIFRQKCALCHGVNGEGVSPYPKLIGVEPRTGFPFGTDSKIPKTIGNYWPYATTVYDYVHRAMPFTAPGSLEPNEVYSLVAYLLAENAVIPRNAVMNAQTLPQVQMPARAHFVPDDRKGGQSFR